MAALVDRWTASGPRHGAQSKIKMAGKVCDLSPLQVMHLLGEIRNVLHCVIRINK